MKDLLLPKALKNNHPCSNCTMFLLVILSKIPAFFPMEWNEGSVKSRFLNSPDLQIGGLISHNMSGVLTPKMISFHKFAIFFSE